MIDFTAAALAYVRFVLGETHQSPHSLATKAGIAPSTLTRALNDPKHKFKLSMATIEKIAAASGINPAPFLEQHDVAGLSHATMFAPGVYDEKKWGRGANSPSDDSRVINVVGQVQTGKWREISIVPYSELAPIRLRHSHFLSQDCFGLVVEGDREALIAKDGEILLCVRWARYLVAYAAPVDLSPTPVVVQEISPDGFKVQLSCKILQKRLGETLVYTADPAAFPGKGVDVVNYASGRLQIMGLVEMVLREPLIEFDRKGGPELPPIFPKKNR